jgi:hypothetical protein
MSKPHVRDENLKNCRACGAPLKRSIEQPREIENLQQWDEEERRNLADIFDPWP